MSWKLITKEVSPRYELMEPLGVGERICEGFDIRAGRDVIIKFVETIDCVESGGLSGGGVSPTSCSCQGCYESARLLKAHRKEISILSEARHPCLPVFLDEITAEGRKGYVMMVIPGEPLHEVFRQLSRAARIKALCDLGGALLYIHRMGEYHGDFKLANVMYDMETGHVYVIDPGGMKDLCSTDNRTPEHDPESPIPCGPYTDLPGFAGVITALLPDDAWRFPDCFSEGPSERPRIEDVLVRLEELADEDTHNMVAAQVEPRIRKSEAERHWRTRARLRTVVACSVAIVLVVGLVAGFVIYLNMPAPQIPLEKQTKKQHELFFRGTKVTQETLMERAQRSMIIAKKQLIKQRSPVSFDQPRITVYKEDGFHRVLMLDGQLVSMGDWVTIVDASGMIIKGVFSGVEGYFFLILKHGEQSPVKVVWPGMRSVGDFTIKRPALDIIPSKGNIRHILHYFGPEHGYMHGDLSALDNALVSGRYASFEKLLEAIRDEIGIEIKGKIITTVPKSGTRIAIQFPRRTPHGTIGDIAQSVKIQTNLDILIDGKLALMPGDFSQSGYTDLLTANGLRDAWAGDALKWEARK